MEKHPDERDYKRHKHGHYDEPDQEEGMQFDEKASHAEEATTVNEFKRNLSQSALGLASKLQSLQTLDRAQTQDVINYLSDFTESGFLEMLRKKICSLLKKDDSKNKQDLNEMFDSLQDSFFGLKTEEQRLNALKESEYFVRPETYMIGVGEKRQTEYGILNVTRVEFTGQHLSMGRVLKHFFELPHVLKHTLRNVEKLKKDSSYVNVIQSPLWKQIEERNFPGRIVFPLNLYFNDAEPDLVTEDSSSAQKLGAVYYNIPCIPQHLLSSLENNFVASIFVSDEGLQNMEAAFTPIINDLKNLETEGINIHTDDGNFQIYFAFVHFLGNNTVVNQVTGYNGSLRENYFCRSCKENRNVTIEQRTENKAMLRTEQNYLDDLKINDSAQTGIRFECFFNQLASYHVVMNTAFDLRHNFFERVCQYDMCAVIHELLENDVLTIKTLNNRIQNFCYDDSNIKKLPIITYDHIRPNALKMTAEEMYFFVCHFGLMVGDLVPEKTEGWRLYLKLIEVLDIICTPYVRTNAKSYLTVLIDEHHEVYTEITDCTLMPEHHFMVHYPEIMINIGPLINLWGVEFKSNREDIERSEYFPKYRNNLPLTAMERHSIALSARMMSRKGFSKDVTFHPDEESIKDVENLALFQNLLPVGYENASVVERATVLGTEYKRDTVLVINYEDDLPLFGSIEWLVKPLEEDELVKFIMKGFHTVGYHKHLHAYELRDTPEWFFVDYDELISCYPTISRVGADGQKYVTFRHTL